MTVLIAVTSAMIGKETAVAIQWAPMMLRHLPHSQLDRRMERGEIEFLLHAGQTLIIGLDA